MRRFFPSTQTFYTFISSLYCDNMSHDIELIGLSQHYVSRGIYMRDSATLRDCYELLKDYKIGDEPIIEIQIQRSDFEDDD